MHDPSVVVFDLPSPVVRWRKSWTWKNAPRWGVRRRRYTNSGKHKRSGLPMFPWYRPRAFEVFVAGRRVESLDLLTVWHEEPGGADSGSVCGRLPSGSDFTWANARWAWVHRDHLRIQWRLGHHTWRWFARRCSDCGRRLGYQEAWFSLGGWDSPRSGHQTCLSIQHLRGQRDDALRVAMGIATETENWRTRRLITNTADALAAAEMGLSRQDARDIADTAWDVQ